MDKKTINDFPKKVPPQVQSRQPGFEYMINPKPIFEHPAYKAGNKLEGKIAIVTGGDSGIGRAVSVAFAKEGADVAILYLDEHQDAETTKTIIESYGRKCLLISGDVGLEPLCQVAVKKIIDKFGKLDILVNNAGEQHVQESIVDITSEQLERTFKTNIFSMFYMVKACMPYLKAGSSIINTSSITAFHGHKKLLDYSATKGAITVFTRSLALSLVDKEIRVNSVAPGPVWTPLIPASFSEKEVSEFGSNAPMGRLGQPIEIAQAYVYLASVDSSYMTGQTLHVSGGHIING